MTGAHEKWLPVRGYEGQYEVSDLGAVRSVDRVSKRGRHFIRLAGRCLRGTITSHGYVAVSLRNAGQRQVKRYVHQLVAEAFLTRKAGDEEVNHLNGNKQQNGASNLEWCTRAQNMAHAWDNGLVREGRTVTA